MKIGLIQGIEVLKAVFVLHVNLKYTFNQILFGSVCLFNNIPDMPDFNGMSIPTL